MCCKKDCRIWCKTLDSFFTIYRYWMRGCLETQKTSANKDRGYQFMILILLIIAKLYLYVNRFFDTTKNPPPFLEGGLIII